LSCARTATARTIAKNSNDPPAANRRAEPGRTERREELPDISVTRVS
jgi:hypothetical protein